MFIRAIERTKSYNLETINLGGIIPTSLSAAAKVVKLAMGVPEHPIEHINSRPLEVKHAFPTYQKSVDLLGYCENVGWEEGVVRMANWAKTRGPQPWINNDAIELDSPLLPDPWREVIGQTK